VFNDVDQTGVMAEIKAPPRVHDDTGVEDDVVHLWSYATALSPAKYEGIC